MKFRIAQEMKKVICLKDFKADKSKYLELDADYFIPGDILLFYNERREEIQVCIESESKLSTLEGEGYNYKYSLIENVEDSQLPECNKGTSFFHIGAFYREKVTGIKTKNKKKK